MLALPCARGSTGWLERKRCSSAFWLLPGWLPHSPYPGFGNQPEFHRLDFALVDANHALDELDTQVNVGRHKLRTKHPAGWRYGG